MNPLKAWWAQERTLANRACRNCLGVVSTTFGALLKIWSKGSALAQADLAAQMHKTNSGPVIILL